MTRVYNFGAGPAQLPEAVLLEMRDELLNWRGTGMSAMELPHRGSDFEKIAHESEQDLRELLAIPKNYRVLFLQGGGRSQFAMVPMNLAYQAICMAYMDTGVWSQFALQEAQRYGNVHLVASSADNHYTDIPPQSSWSLPKEAAYLHYTDNETIHGIEFPAPPTGYGFLLVSDMSSNLLTRPFDISQFGIIYACAQKNMGAAGVTVVIIREDLLQREPFPYTPSMFRYGLHAENNSFLNTPPTLAWYITSLVLKWTKKQGGVSKMAEQSQRKSAKLYAFIDQSDFYHNPVEAHCRSRINVPFILAKPELDQQFLKEATKMGLANLKGHRLVGGMRASLYNALPESAVDALIEFMQYFEASYA